MSFWKSFRKHFLMRLDLQKVFEKCSEIFLWSFLDDPRIPYKLEKLIINIQWNSPELHHWIKTKMKPEAKHLEQQQKHVQSKAIKAEWVQLCG